MKMHASYSIFVVCMLFMFVEPMLAQDKTKQAKQLEGKIEQLEPELSELIDVNLQCEVLATGYTWSEGPVWIEEDKSLLFSDVPKNVIHCWNLKDGASRFLEKSGFDAKDSKSPESEPGSNGLMLDSKGRLTVCDHGNRRVYRIEKDGSKTTIADKFDGKRFNSPNDLVFHSNGDIYFTDPPYGLKDESKRELDWFGVYRVKPDGSVDLITKELHRPNGIGLSPDEKTLYVAQSHKPKAVYMAYPVKDDGTIGQGKVLFDATELMTKDPGAPDGMTVDVKGNLWATGPGGVLIISPKGKLLGRIMTGRRTANCVFGEDGSTLFMTAHDRLLRIPTKTLGKGFEKK